MAKWTADVYKTLADAETAIETIDDTVDIRAEAFKEGAQQKVLVAQGSTSNASRQEHISFFVSDMQASVTLDDSGTADASLPSVIIATGDMPTGHTIDAVFCHLKYGSRKDTSTADNAIDGTQYVQVKESVSGSYANAVKIIDNGMPIDVSEATVMGGDVVFGNIDVVAQVAAENKTYDFQWTDSQVDGNNIILYDVQTIIEVRWH
jgi:hypothetical protein